MTLLCVTANAAIDKRYDLTELTPGEIQRVRRVSANAGGKGINAARGARLAGADVVATGFVGGFAGQFILSSTTALGIRNEFVPVAGESRTCVNIIDAAGVSTELLEPGVEVTPADVADLEHRFARLLGEVDAVTISGSLPVGCASDLYAVLVERARAAGRPVVLDAGGPAFSAALAARPTVVKPNRAELSAWAGAPLDDLAAVVEAARALCAEGPQHVVVSLGSEGALAVDARRARLVRAPRVQALNPVGCGDVLVGVLATGLAAGLAVLAALPTAVRASTASAAHADTGVFDPGLAAGLEVPVTEIGQA